MDTEGQLLVEDRPKLWLSNDRIFDIDPAHVPQAVITALKELSGKEEETIEDMRRQRICNIFKTVDKDSMAMSHNPSGVSEDDWNIAIPDEYMQYLIPESVIEEEDRHFEKR
ncbi:hypothetical protein QM012_005564 [Aureobasidium pullulans]|uniref:Uncharacterized protein n=1 Tax=Aureobasidium pullulans TaxID=5580 RepID=A0ABR0T5X1_AURPU